VEVDRVAAEEVLLEPQRARDLRVVALDDRAVPLRQQGLELVGTQEAGRERDPVASPQRLVEVVEVGAAVLVVLEAAERRAGGDDPETQPPNLPGRGRRAVRSLDRAAVKLRDRRDAREARRVLVDRGLRPEQAV